MIVPDYASLEALLVSAIGADAVEDYRQRNRFVYMAMGRAAARGYDVGYRYDPAEPDWPVVYIELPTGQVSWHLPQHPVPWDNSPKEEQRERIKRFVALRKEEHRRDPA